MINETQKEPKKETELGAPLDHTLDNKLVESASSNVNLFK